MDDLEGDVSESGEAILLKRAYALALEELDPEVQLDEAAKTKLAKIVATVAQKRMQAGGELASDKDALSVAVVAGSRFLNLRAD